MGILGGSPSGTGFAIAAFCFGFFRGDGLAVGRSDDACVEADGKQSLLMLIGEIDELAEFFDDGLGGRVAVLGLLHGELVLLIAEMHDLDVAPAGFTSVPFIADLLVNLEILASQAHQCLPEFTNEPRVLGAFLLGNDVAVGLEQHTPQQLTLRGSAKVALCHKIVRHTNHQTGVEVVSDNPVEAEGQRAYLA
jgi:hypothetical protein